MPLQTDGSIPGVDISNLKSFVLSVFVVQYLVGFTQAHLFGMIKNLQISTHLALYSVPFTANTWVIFQILLTCVKYDFLPIEEIIDFKFTETSPRNERFEQLGYESSNFIEILGSISLYIFLFFPIIGGVSALAYAAKVNIKSTWVRKRIAPTRVKQGVVRFVLETFFELFVASVLISGMLVI